ncbi:MAG: DUF3391 domain-containing protein [Proteobacteria bacterium]|nr:DUF3391 domain-containing protein [Pseudomonadota bacterium]
MATKNISIADLKKGMFIHKLDISWIKAPFLRHKRQINTDNDILLLKKSGVKNLVIDLSRSKITQDTAKKKVRKTQDLLAGLADEQVDTKNDQTKQAETPKQELKQELKVAKKLQGKISNLVKQLNASIKQGQPPSIEAISPIIDETRESLKRNDQALLTMLHLYRKNIKLSDHGFGVFSVVIPLAMRIGCSEEEINELGLAALLHDTGLSRLPMHLIGKHTKYTAAEKQLIQQHPDIVENVLKKSPDFSENLKKLVKQHHEVIDGSGYPYKLRKDSIYPLVEILQVADAYDEYIHGLNDKPGMLPANALKLIYQAAKKNKYSEAVVSELIHVMGIYPLTSAVQLSTGEKALVEEIDKEKPLFPRLRIIYSADGKPCKPGNFIDLASQDKNDNRSITKILEPLNKAEDPLGLLRITHV